MTRITPYTDTGRRIGSTVIREVLAEDHLAEAEMLLSHFYRLSGRVVCGNALGRRIGFPTANISLRERQVPINGVYVVEVYGIRKKPLPGIANIGIRPTVSAFHQLLEVHLLDITINLYGWYIEVVICEKIRNEKKFFSLQELQQQISTDSVIARDYFYRLTRKYAAIKRNRELND